jgi:N-acyl-D-aspartate/D-glutamate deacylase
MFDVLIINGMVIDGTGNDREPMDIGIKAGIFSGNVRV